MTTETVVPETTPPLELRDAKPSEIVRSLSPEHACAGVMRQGGSYCGVGWLGLQAGWQWPDRCRLFVTETYGMTEQLVDEVVEVFDDHFYREGPTAAIEAAVALLERHGY